MPSCCRFRRRIKTSACIMGPSSLVCAVNTSRQRVNGSFSSPIDHSRAVRGSRRAHVPSIAFSSQQRGPGGTLERGFVARWPTVDPQMRQLGWLCPPLPPLPQALNHYILRSKEEFREKRLRGSAMRVKPKPWQYWRDTEATCVCRAAGTCSRTSGIPPCRCVCWPGGFAAA